MIKYIFYMVANLLFFFLVPQLFLSAKVGIIFWILIVTLSGVTIWAVWIESYILIFYLLFIVFVVFFGNFIQSAVGLRFLSDSEYPSPVNPYVMAVFTVHIIGVIAGTCLAKDYKSKEKDSGSRQKISISSMMFAAIALFVVAGFTIWAVGVETFFALRMDRFGDESLTPLLHFLLTVGKFIPYIVLALAYQQAMLRKQNGIFWVLAIVIFLISVCFSNPTNTARYISLGGLLFFCVFAMSVTGKIRKMKALMFFSPGLLIIGLPISSQLRHGLDAVTGERILSKFSSLEFSSMQLFVDGLSMTDQLGSNYTTSGLFVLVPRAIWTTKAESLGPEIAEASGYVFFNAAVPSFFAPFVDFGFIGLFLFSVAVGYVMRWAKLRNYANWKSRRDIYPIFLFCLTPLLVRGDLSTFMISVYAILIAYEFCRLASRLTIGNIIKKNEFNAPLE